MPAIPTWDVYAEQLSDHGYGYALWDPEPSANGEVLIGDVGFIDKGRFIRVFNTLRSAEDDVNQACGVPSGFQPLILEDWLFTDREPRAVDIGTLSGGSVTSLHVGAEIDAKAAGGKFNFHCAEGHGAVLVVHSPAKQQALTANRLVKSYICKNFSEWYRWATNDRHFIIREKDLVFVTGWVKTTEWAMAALVEKGQAAQLEIYAGYESLAGASFSLAMSTGSSRAWSQHSGPHFESESGDTSSPLSDSSSRPRQKRKHKARSHEAFTKDRKVNQCVFVQYSRVGFREKLQGILPSRLPKKMKAAAEPKDQLRLESDDDDSSAGAATTVSSGSDDSYEEFPAIPPPYDPLQDMVDYIFEVCQQLTDILVNMADINVIYQREPRPAGRMQVILRTIWPAVEVDESGVGCLSLDSNNHSSQSFIADVAVPRQVDASTDPSSINTEGAYDRLQSSSTSHPSAAASANPRAKAGCWTCRLRRKRCDGQGESEGGTCASCRRVGLECLGWGAMRPQWMRDKEKVSAYRDSIKEHLTRIGVIRGPASTTPAMATTGAGPSSLGGSSAGDPRYPWLYDSLDHTSSSSTSGLGSARYSPTS